MKKLLSRALLVFAVMAIAFGVYAAPSQAASQKTKAVKSYKKYLTKKNLKAEYRPGKADNKFPSKNAYFALVYLDNDDIPELLVKYMKDGYGGGTYGAGQIRAYANGKTFMVRTLSDYKRATRVYPKTGIIDIVESDDAGGFFGSLVEYQAGTSKVKAGYACDDGEKVNKITYTVADKNATAQEYYNCFASLTKGVNGEKINWHKNTKANRKKYLK